MPTIIKVSGGGSGGNGSALIKSFTKANHGFVSGQFVTPLLELTDASISEKAETWGMVIRVTNVNTFDVVRVGWVDISDMNLTAGAYYLSATVPGGITATPREELGDTVKAVLQVRADGIGCIIEASGYQISDGTSGGTEESTYSPQNPQFWGKTADTIPVLFSTALDYLQANFFLKINNFLRTLGLKYDSANLPAITEAGHIPHKKYVDDKVATIFTPITENQYGNHPAFTTQHAYNVWLLQNGSGNDIVPPLAPAGVTVSNIQDVTASVLWNAATDDVAVEGYNVYLNGIKENAALVTSLSYGLTSLIAGTSYKVKVTAVDTSGNETKLVDATEVTFLTKPATVTGFTSTDTGQTSVTLKWNAVTGATSYKIYRSLTGQNTYTEVATGIAGTTHTDSSGLTVNTSYDYKAKATNTTGDSVNFSLVHTAVTDNVNNAPVITLTGGDMDILKGSTYTDPGYSATDTEDGALTVVVSGSVDTSQAGVYTLTYTTKDSEGLTDIKTRNVTVRPPAPNVTVTAVSSTSIRIKSN